jgi:hypothetical protein
LASLDTPRVWGAEGLAPLSNRFVGNGYSTFSQEIFDISQTRGKPVIQPWAAQPLTKVFPYRFCASLSDSRQLCDLWREIPASREIIEYSGLSDRASFAVAKPLCRGGYRFDSA